MTDCSQISVQRLLAMVEGARLWYNTCSSSQQCSRGHLLMMSPVSVRVRVSARLLALLLALSAGWPAIPSARAAALPIPAGLTIEQDDRNAILLWDFDTK